ncbi:hypothetical protein SH2C18_23000 [Clostridium sediminicola]
MFNIENDNSNSVIKTAPIHIFIPNLSLNLSYFVRMIIITHAIKRKYPKLTYLKL